MARIPGSRKPQGTSASRIGLLCCRPLRLWPSVHIPDTDGLVGLERALEIELLCHLAHRRKDFLAEQADAGLGILV
jgi:hypothetical protein